MMIDPGELYEFSILDAEGFLNPFVRKRLASQEEANRELEEFGQTIVLKEGEDLVYARLFDA